MSPANDHMPPSEIPDSVARTLAVGTFAKHIRLHLFRPAIIRNRCQKIARNWDSAFRPPEDDENQIFIKRLLLPVLGLAEIAA